MKLVGIVLIILGLAGLLYGRVSWTRKEQIVDAGPVEISRTRHETMRVPPVVGGLLLIGGVALVMKRRG